MLYFDTSFLIPFIIPEPSSVAVERFLSSPPSAMFAISHWTQVEFSSFLGRELRMRGLTEAAAGKAEARFADLTAKAFEVILPEGRDFHRANTLLRDYKTGLRAGDALHLAIAQNHFAASIYTFDKTLQRAAQRSGLPANSGFHG